MGTPSSSAIASLSVGSHSSTILTANGFAVRARVSRNRVRRVSGSRQVMESMPNPPASLTAAASAGVVMPPTGACTIGRSIPTRRQNAVLKRRVIGEFSLSYGPKNGANRDIRLRALSIGKSVVSCRVTVHGKRVILTYLQEEYRRVLR